VTHTHRKRFGQNFLHDATKLDDIVTTIHLKENDHIIEIGPGQGALTQRLTTSSSRLDLIEIDRDLISYLKHHFNAPHIHIHQADILKFDLTAIISKKKRARIIGNLPYNISTPILFKLFNCLDCIQDMHFLLQKEVVLRMAAAPGSKTYGRLSIMTQYFCEVKQGIHVPPEAFTPPPKVDSSIVHLTPHTTPPYQANDFKRFEHIVRNAFSQRRKTIRNALKKVIDTSCLESLGILPSLRPEQLSIADYVNISNLAPVNSPPTPLP
jgi:16S rRNA (adenine1518-N6/adenine1519-N6)-dimethyltransferase